MSIPRFTVIALIAAAVAAAAIAAWPASETDKARDDGEHLGEAVSQLYHADSTAEVDAALAEMDEAAADTRDHAGDEVAGQVAAQEDALARAADGFVGSVTAGDEFEQALYQAELEVALDDLTGQASDFRAQGPEVRQAYWEGVEDGLSTD
jgi:ABC-type sugar transport system substrate-binding protein